MSTTQFYKLPVEIAGRRDLTPASKILWAVLADRIGDNGFCWAGVRILARDTGLTVTGVLGCLRLLEKRGDLQIERRGIGRANHYRLTSQSVQQSCALKKPERSGKLKRGAQQTCAQALNRVELNQTDQLNQTHIKISCPKSPEALRLAELLLSEIRRRKPDYRKPDLKAWAKHIDLMIRRDKRNPERIREVIEWCQLDDFWQSNILSTEKLRKQFDKLEMDMEKRPGRQAVAPPQRGLDGLTARQRALKETTR